MPTLDFSASLSNISPRRGFTLVETVVTLGIVVILSAIMVGYSRNAAKSLALAAKESAVVGVVLHAKSLAQSFVLNPPSGEIICAYGIHADRVNGSIFVFQDRVADTGSCSDSDNIYTAGERLSGSSNDVNLGDQFSFIASTDPASPDLNNVIFIPPDLDVVINNDEDISSGSIIIGITNDLANRFTIKVNKLGQIDRE